MPDLEYISVWWESQPQAHGPMTVQNVRAQKDLESELLNTLPKSETEISRYSAELSKTLKVAREQQLFGLNYFHYINHFTNHIKVACIKIENESLLLSRIF